MNITNMTPQEKARALAEAVKYCKENKLFLPGEEKIIKEGTKEEQFLMACKCLARMERHKEINK